MTEAPYRRETVAPPPEIAAALERLATLHAQARGRSVLGGLVRLGFVLAIVYGIIGAIDLVFEVVHAVHWLVLVVGMTILVLPMLLIQLRDARLNAPAQAAFAGRLRAEAASGRVLRHTLRRDDRHAFVPHEHGVIHVCPADAACTLYLDLSSISDDPRHDHWYAKGLIDRAHWTWFTTADGAVLLGFAAEDDPVPRREVTGLDGGDLFDWLGTPGDGDLVARPWPEVEAFLRRTP
ncbi:hypothetical protein [Roseomonas rosulenta]|uniref:hypothetical protein n=1 Tax=Roseomonas rosulenta TaxID=2748667 RepID=UPI0018DF4E38|nr:hypothetical protein [Roseomonas rosulenta]